MNRLKNIIFSILLLSVVNTTAQITVQGFVNDFTNIPVPYATVTAVFAHQKSIAAFAFTADNGTFSLNITKPVSDSLIISANLIGYKKIEKIIILDPDKNNYKVDFQLSNEKFSLPTLTIKADKADKIMRKDTTTFKVKYFVDSTERVLEDILRKLPGMTVKEDGSLEYKGKPIERILVEGDDLFNTNNKIPSKNLHASLIEEVQVIDRYSSNPLLKNIENSERQIINLNFKKDRKKAIFGNLSLGGGIVNRYENNTNIISFIGKTKIFELGGLNNTGTNLGNSISNNDGVVNRFNNPDYYDPSVESAILIPKPRLSAPNLNERRTNINQTALSSLNFLTRPTENWIFKVIGTFSKDRLIQEQNNLTEYLLGNNQFSVREVSKSTLKPFLGNLHIDNTIPLSKNANLKVINEYKNENTSFTGNINLNNKNIEQKLGSRSDLWRNLMSLTVRLSDSTAIIVEGAYINDKRPQGLLLIPKENYVDFVNQPNLNFVGLNQQTEVSTEYGGGVARLVKAWRGSHKINFSMGGSFRRDNALSTIFTENTGEKQLFNDSNYINRLNYYTQDFFTAASYNIDIGDFNVGGRLTFVQRHNELSDAIDSQNNFKVNWFYPTPRLTIKWKWNLRNSLLGTYNYKANFADLDDVYGGYLFKDYRHLNRNIVTPYRVNGHSFSGLYRFNNSEKKIEGFFNVFYIIDANARNRKYSFTPFLISTESVNQKRNNQSLLVMGQVIKFLPKQNLSVKTETNHTIYTSFNSIGNNNVNKNTQINSRYLTQFVSTFDGVFNYIAGAAYSVNQQITKTNGQEINPIFSQKQVCFKTNLRFNKRLLFTINNEYNSFKSQFGKNENRIFTDITAQYELKPSKVFIYFDLFNLFDVKQFTFASTNINQIAIQNYTLQPRIQVLKAEWRF
jgi:hypothetical protein